jgi:NitT/TauT family transport system permease protein
LADIGTLERAPLGALNTPAEATTPAPATRRAARGGASTRLLSVVGLLIVWAVAAALSDSRLLPSPFAVAVALVHESRSGSLFPNLGLTLARIAASFALAMVFGTAIGLAMGRWRQVDLLFDSWITTLLNMPALVVIVLIYVWFGLSDAALVVAVALNKLPTTAVTIREGARAVDRGLIDMARSFRMRPVAILRHVLVPQLTPYLFAAARSGLAIIWKIVLVAELLGRSDGVGFEIGVYFQLFDVTHILAYTGAFIVVVQAMEWGFLQPLERYISRWRP